MPYSAVTQPWPLPRSQGGSRSSTLALHSTCVSPNLMRHEPSAWRVKPGIISITRIWSGERPDGRMPAPVFRDPAQRLAAVALRVPPLRFAPSPLAHRRLTQAPPPPPAPAPLHRNPPPPRTPPPPPPHPP